MHFHINTGEDGYQLPKSLSQRSFVFEESRTSRVFVTSEAHFPLRKPLKHPVAQPDRCRRQPTPRVPGRRWAHTCRPRPPPGRASKSAPLLGWQHCPKSLAQATMSFLSSQPHSGFRLCPACDTIRGVPGVNPTDAPRAHHVPLILELIPVRCGPWRLLGCFFPFLVVGLLSFWSFFVSLRDSRS